MHNFRTSWEKDYPHKVRWTVVELLCHLFPTPHPHSPHWRHFHPPDPFTFRHPLSPLSNASPPVGVGDCPVSSFFFFFFFLPPSCISFASFLFTTHHLLNFIWTPHTPSSLSLHQSFRSRSRSRSWASNNLTTDAAGRSAPAINPQLAHVFTYCTRVYMGD